MCDALNVLNVLNVIPDAPVVPVKSLWDVLPTGVQDAVFECRNRLYFNDCMEEFLERGPNDSKGKGIRIIVDKVDAMTKDKANANKYYNLEAFMLNELMLIHRPFINGLFAGAPLPELYFMEIVGTVKLCEDCRSNLYHPDVDCFCNRTTYLEDKNKNKNENALTYNLEDVIVIKEVLERFQTDTDANIDIK